MAVSPLYAVFLIALLAQGAAAGAFRGIDRAVLSHLHSARRGRIYAAYALVWAVGAVLGPQLVSGVLVVADWRAVFVVIALCFLPTILIASRTELPSMDAERSLSRSALRELLQRRSVIGACVGIMLVGAIEGILFTWLVYYASSFYEPTTANLLLSVYLLAYMPARLGYTFLIDRVPSLLLVLATAIPTIPALAVAFSGQTRDVLGDARVDLRAQQVQRAHIRERALDVGLSNSGFVVAEIILAHAGDNFLVDISKVLDVTHVVAEVLEPAVHDVDVDPRPRVAQVGRIRDRQATVVKQYVLGVLWLERLRLARQRVRHV